MKQIILFLIIAMAVSCTATIPVPDNQKKITELRDSVNMLTGKLDTAYYMIESYENGLIFQQNNIRYQDSVIQSLTDSLMYYRAKPVMTPTQFINLFKYERILKYYYLCEKKPSNWVYFKGWIRRAITE